MSLKNGRASAQGSRLVALERSLAVRSRAFAHYVIAHEFAHALLWNRGRHLGEDPEVAADSLAAAWGFPRPATLPLLIPLTQPLPTGERRRRR